MPHNKEALLKQAKDCRVRVQFVLDMKNDVGVRIDDACSRLTEELQQMENAAQTANATQIKLLTQRIRRARQLLKDYEEALERVRSVDEDTDFFDRSVLAVLGNQQHHAEAAVPEPVAPPPAFDPSVNHERMPSASGNAFSGQPILATTVQQQRDDVTTPAPAADAPIIQERAIPAPAQAQMVALPDNSERPLSVFPDEELPAQSVSAMLDNQQQRVETTVSAPTVATSSAVSVVDFRKSIASKGTGNTDEWCQKSVDLLKSDPVSCTLSHVESPSLFWVRLFTCNVETIEEDLNFELDTEKRALSNPQVGDYCAAPVPPEIDKNMHRAKILEIKENSLGTSFAKILYIDWGKVDWVATKALVELPSRYRHYLRQACPCALSELVPTGGFWTGDVIIAFRELCTADEFELFVTGLDEDTTQDIKTVTLHRTKRGGAKPETILISMIKSAIGKVRRKESNVPMVAFETEGAELIGGLNPPDDTDGWRCNVSILERIEVEDLEMKKLVETEREAIRLTLAARMASAITPGEFRQVPLTEHAVIDDMGNIYFQVCEVITPGNFYIQLSDTNGKNEVLETLSAEMYTYYSNPTHQRLLQRTDPNQAAVVLSTLDGVTSFRRVLLKDWTPSEMDGNVSRDIRVHCTYLAVFVDHGYCQRVQGKDVFILEKRFCDVPAQAAFCQLFGCRPTTFDGRWDQTSIDVFKQIAVDGRPQMRALLCSERQPYELIMYRQEPNGEWTWVNKMMVDFGLAFGDIQFF